MFRSLPRVLPLSALLAALLASGCAHHADRPAPPTAGFIGTYEAVRAAQDDPARGISGAFVIAVQATGSDDTRIYLNSERDYRHPLNVTVAMDARLRAPLEQALGLRLEQLPNRRLQVRGTARRVQIAFYGADGQRSNKYYYQTQIQVTDPRQIQFAP